MTQTASGTVVRAPLQAGTCRCCSGFGSRTARGVRRHMCECRSGRAPGGVEVRAGARVPVGGGHRGLAQRLLCTRCSGRAPGGVEVASRAGLPVERNNVI